MPDEERSVAEVRAWLERFGDLLPIPLSSSVDPSAYAAKLCHHAEIIQARREGEPAGMLVMYANDAVGRIAHIPLLAVAPGFRRQGLARVMLSRAIALARERRMDILWLTVEPSNAPARKLYEQAGMRTSREENGKLRMYLDLEADRTPLEVVRTPIHSGDRLAALMQWDIDLRIKRDDLYPLAGGGSKARKTVYVIRDAIDRGYDAVVSTGGAQSNHARSLAVLSSQVGLTCHIVIATDEGRDAPLDGNRLLMDLSGATIEFCRKDGIAGAMDGAMARLQRMGHRPLYVWGGGHSLAGTLAFVDAAQEAKEQCGALPPDFVVLASATGSTQAGLHVGYANTRTEVFGISVARDRHRGAAAVDECISWCQDPHDPIAMPPVRFYDDWTDGGYERYGEAVLRLIALAAQAGLHFDPTYSGKGLRGLGELVRRGDIPAGSRVLFWHTGGLMNLMAARLPRLLPTDTNRQTDLSENGGIA